jgi:hypothetical protein
MRVRRWWVTAMAVLVLCGLAAPAGAAPVQDACNQVSDARKDLREVELVYSASSFSVRATGCANGGPSGDWFVVLRLSGFPSEVVVSGVYSDLGKYVDWSGFAVCAQGECAVGPAPNGLLRPPGTPIDGPCIGYFDSCQGAPMSYGHGAWADVLPEGWAVPEEISWWAEVRVREGQGSRLADRLPESGTVTTARNTATVPTRVTVASEGPPTWLPFGTQAYSYGRLTTDTGAPVLDRSVRVRDVVAHSQLQQTASDGRWGADYVIRRNTAARAAFSGDGVHDPASAPFTSYVRAWVTLDLKEVLEVPRYAPLELRGVVRPRASGLVRIHVREDRSGAPWKLLRYTDLRQGQYDSWYTTTWRPQVSGRWMLRARWDGGTSEPGGVLSGASITRWVTVR